MVRTLTTFGQALLRFLYVLDAARLSAAAVERQANPRAMDLRLLGIDPAAFAGIRRL